MAWRGYLADPLTKGSGTSVVTTVLYYDDADPLNANVGAGPPPVPPAVVLHQATLTIPSGYTQAQVATLIRSEGQRGRDAVTLASTLNGNFPVGSTIAIP